MTTLNSTRILICNDDGIEAPGLALLAEAARAFTDDVWIVAPRTNQSARGRAFSVRTTVYARKQAEREYAVDGTPADCAILGLNGLIPGRCPDLVLSGVNEGANLGEEIPSSGTVGACLQAGDQGVRAIAFSQFGAYHDTGPAAWATAREWLPRLLPDLVARLDDESPVLNVNFPPGAVSGVRATPVGRRPGPVRIEPRPPAPDGRVGFYVDELRPDAASTLESDIGLLLGGFVTVTPLSADPTATASLGRLGRRLNRD